MTKTNAGDRLNFHQGDKLATVKQGTQNHSVFRSLDTALAEQLKTGAIRRQSTDCVKYFLGRQITTRHQ